MVIHTPFSYALRTDLRPSSIVDRDNGFAADEIILSEREMKISEAARFFEGLPPTTTAIEAARLFERAFKVPMTDLFDFEGSPELEQAEAAMKAVLENSSLDLETATLAEIEEELYLAGFHSDDPKLALLFLIPVGWTAPQFFFVVSAAGIIISSIAMTVGSANEENRAYEAAVKKKSLEERREAAEKGRIMHVEAGKTRKKNAKKQPAQNSDCIYYVPGQRRFDGTPICAKPRNK